MRLTFRKIGALVFVVYLLITCYTGYTLLSKKLRRFFLSSNLYIQNSSKTHFEEKYRTHKLEPKPLDIPNLSNPSKQINSQVQQDIVIEIWGKAAIGLFLWEHVLHGHLEEKLGGIWSYGSKKVGRLKFRFRTGAGVIPEKVPRDVENLVLILNGREPTKIQYAQMWLDFISKYSSSLRNIALVLLGKEDCDNDWLLPYMASHGGRVKFAFLVYDSLLIDDETFFQWPLGVATYRSFPKQCLLDHENPSTHSYRMYTCNFYGTVYPNSTREELIRVLKASPQVVQRACMIKVRAEWLPKETDQTLAQYVQALTQSDLTLNPAGKNPECYRHFEAMSCGSVPVVLNVTNNSSNNKCSQTSLRLLREFNAPFIWLESWKDLPPIIANEFSLTQEEKIMRRQDVVRWYQDFLRAMRQRFLNIVSQKFVL